MSDPLELHLQTVVSCHVNTQLLGHLASSPRLNCLRTFGSPPLLHRLFTLCHGELVLTSVFLFSTLLFLFLLLVFSAPFLYLLFLHLSQILTSGHSALS